MAAIDKTYTNKWEEYCEYRDWAMGQKFVCPNGDIIRPIDYLFRLNKEDFDGEKWRPIMNTPYSLDYFLIKHCPVKFVCDRLREVYDEAYIESVLNGTSEWDTFTKEGKYGTRFKVKQWRNSMKTIIYAILYVIVTPFWWFVMQIDNALSKLYMHISIKFLESRMKSNDNEE